MSVHKALSHPLRAQILLALEREGKLSPKLFVTTASTDHEELSLNVAAYHFRILSDLDVIEPVEEVPRRGATEHWYAICASSPVPDIMRMSAFLHDLTTQAAGTSVRTNESDGQSAIVPLEVDDKGEEELEGVLRDLTETLAAVATRCRARLSSSRRSATSLKIGFATVARSDQLPRAQIL